MQPSADLVEFLRWWEGLPGGKPALQSYDDGGGTWTIGYGTTRDVRPGDECSEDEALELMLDDIDDVWAKIDQHIRVTIAQHEMDALVALAYNIGAEAFRKSTLLSRLNSGDFGSASDEFVRWNRQGGRILPGLVKRRAAERRIFDDADYSGRP